VSIQHPNHEIAEVFYRLNIGAPVEELMIARAFELILSNPHVKARDAQLGAFLTGLMVKVPSVREIVTLIRTALNIDGVTRFKPTLPIGKKLIGVAGSGKKGCKTFNISTPACFAASAAGAFVAKPGSGATSSISGSKDFLHVVGASLLDPAQMIDVLLSVGIGMFQIENLIPKFDGVYGGKTFGPTPLSFALPAIVNPVACDAELYGLSHPNVLLSLGTFLELGYEDVTVVSSTPDKVHYVDELSSLRINYIGTVRNGVIGKIEEFSPSDITHRPHSSWEELRAGMSLVENAQIVLRILQGKHPGPQEDTVALNAAAILVSSQISIDLSEGFAMAIDSIRSGAAFKKLTEFVEATGGNKRALLTIIGETS
jgi:anthranilate phosphoribosyltransferase